MATITRVAGTPMGSVADAAEAVGGIEEEYFLEGTATMYALAGSVDRVPDGRSVAGRGDRPAGVVPHADGGRPPP